MEPNSGFLMEPNTHRTPVHYSMVQIVYADVGLHIRLHIKTSHTHTHFMCASMLQEPWR